MPTRASDGVAVKASTDTNVPATTSAASVFSIAYDLKNVLIWYCINMIPEDVVY